MSDKNIDASPRVLVVDDYEFNLDMTKDLLEMLNCEVDVASSGEEALQQYQENTYDLIFLDIQMPKKDGYTVCQEMRAYDQENGKQPTLIVALTANAMSGDREKCLSAGMDDYIAKPLRANTLEAILDKYVINK